MYRDATLPHMTAQNADHLRLCIRELLANIEDLMSDAQAHVLDDDEVISWCNTTLENIRDEYAAVLEEAS
jgi:hypothetical protein